MTHTYPTTNREEHWCSKCQSGGRWGNHDSAGHEKWYKDFLDFLAYKETRDAKRTASTSPKSDTSNGPPSSMKKLANVVVPVPGIARRAYVAFTDSDDESF